MDLAGNLKKLRKSKKLTQKDLAKLLSMSTSTIAMYETAKREPDYKTLVKIANFFEISVDQLLDINNERKRKNDTLDTLSNDEADLIYFIRRKWSNLTPDQKKMRFKITKHSIELLDTMNKDEK